MTSPATRCPSCKKPTEKAFRPFCSKRCADADLGRWFAGSYAIPGEPADPDVLAKATPRHEDED